MNHAILIAQVTSAPVTSNPAGSTPRSSFCVDVPPYREEDPPISLVALAWGGLTQTAIGQIAIDRVTANSYLALTGRLRVEKNLTPELELGSIHAVSPDEVPSLNSVCLVGRAGRDPEVRYLESGNVVANLSLAVNRIRRDDGTDWFNLEIWGKQAQVAADYVHKGSLLGITGSLNEQSWTDKDTGEGRSKLIVRVSRLDLLGPPRFNVLGPRGEGAA